jgi:RNA polymerase sigma-70 factor (ECF subfamily)
MNSTLPRSPDDAPADVAIPKLVDAHGGRIYGLGLRMCGNEQDAEDLVQETFLRAYRHWSQFEGRSDPATWLYSIAARVCRRMHRKRAGEPTRVESLSELLPAGEPTVPDVGEGVPDQLDEQVRREARETVEDAIAGLPAIFRQPVVLKEIADFSLAEIADILGIKEATAKTRVHRGRLMLRKALARRLPQREAPPPDHSRQVCLDLLSMKQEALDRGAAFPLPGDVLCDRCRATFATLDLGHGLCLDLGRGRLPEAVREMIMERLEAA